LEDNGTQITDKFTLDDFARWKENNRTYSEYKASFFNFMMINLCLPKFVEGSMDDCWGSKYIKI
jgi:hypothetical protein